MTAAEARKQQWLSLKDKPLSAKLKYIFTYYWPAIVGIMCVLVFLVSWITSILTQKEVVLSGYILNSATKTDSPNLVQEFMELQQIDSDRQQFKLTTDVSYSIDDMSDTSITILESIIVQIAAKQVDFLIAEPESYQMFSAYHSDLRTVLTAEQLEKWDEYFVYVEYDALDKLKNDVENKIQLPEYFVSDEGLSDPVPVGIRLPEDCRLFDSYNMPTGDIYFSIMHNVSNAANTLAFLEFILD